MLHARDRVSPGQNGMQRFMIQSSGAEQHEVLEAGSSTVVRPPSIAPIKHKNKKRSGMES